jgi:hypothetical protein
MRVNQVTDAASGGDSMRNVFKVFFVSLFFSLVIIRPTSSYAYWHEHEHWHEHSYVGIHLGVWPDSYYYGSPYYYPYYADPYYYPGYAVVASSNYQPVLVNGVTYYLNNGVYYIYTQYGYQAVTAPVGAMTPVISASPATPGSPLVNTSMDDSITVNIPDNNGGYNPVVLKRSGNGFIGPQGEFYSEFPKVSQLKLMYGK